MASIDIDYNAIDREVEDLDTRRQNWIKALRSGEYSQTKGSLYTPPAYHYLVGFCCLGVGAHVLDSPFIKEDIKKGRTSNACEDYDLVSDRYELTPMQKYYLMAMNDRSLVDNNGKIIRMGNLPQRNFKFIARWLEIVFALQKMGSK